MIELTYQAGEYLRGCGRTAAADMHAYVHIDFKDCQLYKHAAQAGARMHACTLLTPQIDKELVGAVQKHRT